MGSQLGQKTSPYQLNLKDFIVTKSDHLQCDVLWAWIVSLSIKKLSKLNLQTLMLMSWLKKKLRKCSLFHTTMEHKAQLQVLPLEAAIALHTY